MPRPARSGALHVLAAGFLISALLRAGDVLAGLPAIADDGFGNGVASADERAGEPAPPATELVAELRRQSDRLTERSRAIDQRAEVLRDVEARLNRRLEELEARRQELEAEVQKAHSAAEDDVRHLSAIYETMKPKQAGRIFDEMEGSFAAGFLAELRPEAAAQILSNMAPDKAYAVSVLLAGRNVERTEAEARR